MAEGAGPPGGDRPEPVPPADRDAFEAECDVDWFSAPGPGGQHKNKTQNSCRILHRPTGLRAQETRHRSRERNREAALDRLYARVLAALTREPPRVPTRKPRGVRARERATKVRQGAVKRLRRRPGGDDDST